MNVPQGLEALPGDGDRVGARVALPLLVVMWLGAILLLGLGILFLVVKPAGPERPGGEVPLWAPLILLALGVVVAVLAWLAGRGHKFVIDDEGVHSQAVFGKAEVRWDAMQDISLSVPRGNAIWFTAPGGILRRGKVTKLKRIPYRVAGLRVRSRDLHVYILERARSRPRSA
jgi:hypothetical protein